jgi:hypothetical protein
MPLLSFLGLREEPEDPAKFVCVKLSCRMRGSLRGERSESLSRHIECKPHKQQKQTGHGTSATNRVQFGAGNICGSTVKKKYTSRRTENQYAPLDW